MKLSEQKATLFIDLMCLQQSPKKVRRVYSKANTVLSREEF